MLDKRGSGEARPGDLAVVRPGRGRAKLERVLGPASAIEAVLEGLLVEAGERGGFEPYDPREPSLEGRVDLRDELTFTIDPETAKDFDDALTLFEDRVFIMVRAGWDTVGSRRRRAGVLGVRARARVTDAAARAL